MTLLRVLMMFLICLFASSLHNYWFVIFYLIVDDWVCNSQFNLWLIWLLKSFAFTVQVLYAAIALYLGRVFSPYICIYCYQLKLLYPNERNMAVHVGRDFSPCTFICCNQLMLYISEWSNLCVYVSSSFITERSHL